ncbi:MAG TPA: SIP domain-containing protein [Streptosporangiaceae bacterium]|jgi:NADPH-dependent ferric siderophore reductase
MGQRLPVRFIRVTGVTRLTPRMARITFGGDDLAGAGRLVVDAPDQQVKLYFPRPGQDAPRLPDADGDLASWYGAFVAIPDEERPWMRSYTLRAADAEAGTVTVDFVLHPDAGPATRWAMAAAPGDTLGMFGPSPDFARPVPLRGSVAAADWVLLAGDETALPAIGTLLEALPSGARGLAFVEVADAAAEQPPAAPSGVDVRWVRAAGGPGAALVAAVEAAEFPGGAVFAWLAGEAGMVRALRRHLVGVRGVAKRSIDFSGYWRRDLAQDDAPTEADFADADELLAHAQELTAGPPPSEGVPGGLAVFDAAYRDGTAPWVIGAPQPAVVELERTGGIRGAVLDAGCGTGEHTILLTERGYDVLGVDASVPAVEAARANAAGRGVAARFAVADALRLSADVGAGAYDTVLDSALFHIFGDADRERYVAELRRVCRPRGRVFVLALSDEGPGFGPEVSDTVIRTAFTGGWAVEDLARTVYRGVTGADGEHGDLPAWLARVRRV